MKIGTAQAGSVLLDPSRYAGILLHGDDAGLVRDTAMRAARVVVGTLDDPFRSCVLTKEEHPRLYEEATALSLAGGRRVVRVVDCGDGLAAALGKLSSDPAGALVILEAPSLAARSKLRQWAEKAPAWGCIACYPESGRALAASIRRSIRAAGREVSDDAVELLCRDLGGDMLVRRSELEKLVLFAEGCDMIDAEMVRQCRGGGMEPSMDLLLAGIMVGDVTGGMQSISAVMHDGANGAGLVIGFSQRLQRVLKVSLAIQAGQTGEEVVRSLVPPVFNRDAELLVREARAWPVSALRRLLSDSCAADVACKRAGSRDATIAAQLLLLAALRARAAARSARAAQ